MNRTKIPWVKNPDGTQGFTCSPKTGCLNNCPYCYACKLAYGRLRKRYLANNILAPTVGEGIIPYNTSRLIDSITPFYPRWWPHKLEQIRRRKKPAGIFLDDMSDWAADYWPEEWTRAEMETIKACPQHRFYLLTKQPQNLKKWSPFPKNCYVGVTVTANGFAPLSYQYLSMIEAKVRYISFEPLLGSIGRDELRNLATVTDWWIIGAQTRPDRSPRVEWVREIVEEGDKAGISIFHKDNLGWPEISADGSAPFYKKSDSGTWILRQEMPKQISHASRKGL